MVGKNKNVTIYVDNENKFSEVFNSKTGAYMRSGIIEDGKDTGVDPFMRNFPQLIDVGIMGRCACSKFCKVDCYQRAADNPNAPNMTLENFEKLCKESTGKVFQFALGGKGDPDCHEKFAEILKMSRDYNIVPNFTTSGIAFTKEKAELCKQYCGAVAVSWHDTDYTHNALKLLLKAGVKTNIHYVLGKNTINDAIARLKGDGFPEGINAIVFLLYKPIGFGRMENVLSTEDTELKEFFELIDGKSYPFKIGFDSCTCPAIINLTEKVDLNSIDYCEAARFSMYVSADMQAMPCSFCNQDESYFVDLNSNSISEAWSSGVFEDFRNHFRNSCSECKNRAFCGGGCPVSREIVLCDIDKKCLV